jgi:UDP-2,3-diacylglucosamine hydrolase
VIAVVAGKGLLPAEACRSLLNKGENFFIISLFSEDNESILKKETLNNNILIISQPYYKAGQILDFIHKEKASKVFLIGKFDKKDLLEKVKLDWFGMKLFAKLSYHGDRNILQELIDLLKDEGLEVLSQDSVLSESVVQPGILTGAMTLELEDDIRYGLAIAQKMSEYDVGQTVVVKNKMVLAIEAIEGTDECIKRGIELSKGGVVVCKAVCPLQSKKFDLPVLGPVTLKEIKKGEVAAIAWNAKNTLVSRRDLFVEEAKQRNITLFAC